MYRTGQTQIVFPSPSKLFRPGVTAIIILLVSGFLLSTFAGNFAINFFALSAQGVLNGRVWQILTYPFVSNSPINLIFSGLMLLFVGSAIEREWRTASFLLLWLVISIGCGLLWIIVNILFNINFIGMGAAGCTYGLLATMGLLFRGQRLFFFFVTIESQYLVLILIAIGILMSLAVPINLIWIAGASIAYIYVKLRWRMASQGGVNISSTEPTRSDGFVDID
jgi:membrane associated rhomboid family serine protease